MFVKYCGFTREEDLDIAVSLGVDAVGFIFFKGSPRYLPSDRAKALSRHLKSAPVEKVGVFVDAGVAEIIQIAGEAGLDRVQIYDPRLYNRLQGKYPLISCYRIADKTDLNTVAVPRGQDLILLDSRSRQGMGGTGISFDWKLLKHYPYFNRTLLAGGITNENVDELLSMVSPLGLDISSGIEQSPGVKSATKMVRLMERIRLKENEHENNPN